MMSKRALICMMVGGFLAGAGLVGAEVIPIVNGDFEDTSAPNAGVAGWTEVEAQNFSVNIPATPPGLGDGSFWCKLGYSYDTVSLRQDLTNTFDAAFDYTLSFDTVGSSDGTGNSPGSQDFVVQFFDTVQGTVAAEATIIATGTITSNRLAMTSAEAATHLGNPIQIRFNKPGHTPPISFAWLDNVVLETQPALVTGPLVLTHPVGQSALLGSSNIVLAVEASGEDPLGYQWRQDGVDVSGATNQTLALDDLRLSQTGTYTVVVSDSSGDTESNGAEVTVVPAPVLPANQALLEGQQPAPFSVLMPDRPGYTYQWTKDGVDLTGETGMSLQLPAVVLADAGAYGVAVSLGGDTVTSPPAQLTVSSGSISIPVENPDFEAVQSSNVINNVEGWVQGLENEPSSMQIRRPALSGDGSQVLRLGWKYDDVSLRQALPAAYRGDLDYVLTYDVFGSVEGEGITGAAQAYQAIFFDADLGRSLKTVQLEAPAVSQTVTAVLFGCEAKVGEAHNLEIRFYKGAGTANFVWLDNVSVSAVASAPEVCIGQDPADQILLLGATQAVFTAVAGGQEPIGYQWQKDSVAIPGATNDTLIIDLPGNADEGDYTVLVTNPLGSATSATGRLDLVTAPLQPASQVVFSGATAGFEVTMLTNVTGYGYAWFKDGVALPGETSATLTLPGIDPSDAGSYTVVVSLGADSAESDPAELSVLPPAAESYAAEVLADGPVGYWRLGEAAGATSAADEIAGRSGDYYAGVQLEASGALLRDPDTAAGFTNGIFSKVEVPYDPALNPQVFSVEFWARATGGAGTLRSPVTCRDFFGNEYRGYSFYAAGNDRWQLRLGDLSATEQILNGPPVVLDEWAHVVGTFDGSNMTLYVNGAMAASQPAGFAEVNFSGIPLRIGGGQTEDIDGGNFFAGDVDEVAIYDTVLPLERIQLHYTTGAAPEPPVILTIAAPAGSIELTWDGDGVLQETADLATPGSWADILGAASPYSPAAVDQRSYRLRQP